MMELFVTVGVLLALIVGVALILPCEACRLRRERMKRAYAAWQAAKAEKENLVKRFLYKADHGRQACERCCFDYRPLCIEPNKSIHHTFAHRHFFKEIFHKE